MLEADTTTTKAHAAKVLRRAGVPPDQINEVLAELPDPFPVETAEAIFARHGLTIGTLIDWMGGSP